MWLGLRFRLLQNVKSFANILVEVLLIGEELLIVDLGRVINKHTSDLTCFSAKDGTDAGIKNISNLLFARSFILNGKKLLNILVHLKRNVDLLCLSVLFLLLLTLRLVLTRTTALVLVVSVVVVVSLTAVLLMSLRLSIGLAAFVSNTSLQEVDNLLLATVFSFGQ